MHAHVFFFPTHFIITLLGGCFEGAQFVIHRVALIFFESFNSFVKKIYVFLIGFDCNLLPHPVKAVPFRSINRLRPQ